MQSAIKNITVFGLESTGSEIAQVFASCKDIQVTIFIGKKLESKCLDKIKSNLKILKQRDIISEEEINNILNRINFTEDIETATREADLIIECIPGNIESKQNLFMKLESICRTDTIFATCESFMNITKISEKINFKSRVVGINFKNSPYLIHPAEVIKSNFTSNKVMDRTMKLLSQLSKHNKSLYAI